MAGITIDQAIDLGYATLQAFDKDDLQMTFNHPTYEVINNWMKRAKIMDGGDVAKSYITLKDTGNAKHVRMYETDTPNVANTDREVSVNWTHGQNSFSYSMKELAINRGNLRRVYDLLSSRRKNCFREFADLLEEAAWRTPSASDDDREPHGIPGWLVQADADSCTGAFEGYVGDYTTSADAQSAYSTVGGLSCTTVVNTRWANWYYDHNGNLDYGLLKKLSEAFRKTKFQAPIIAKQALDPQSDFSNFRFYTSNNVIAELEDLATKADDRLGADLGKYAGALVYKQLPFIYVDDLDTELTYVRGKDPIYGVNHNHFYPIILADRNFVINKPMNKVGQHDVFTVYIDVSYAYMCDNRRHAGFLLSNWEGAG